MKKKRTTPRKEQRCKGIDVHTDLRKPPLTLCRKKHAPGDIYCAAHASQKQRQDRLRSVLKKKWDEKLIGKRGRPTTEEKPMSKLPPIPKRVQRAPNMLEEEIAAQVHKFPVVPERPNPFRFTRPKRFGET